MPTSPLRVALLWGLGLVLAVIAGIVSIMAVAGAQGPDQPVRAYLDALQAGDGGRALGALHAQVPSGSAALLDGGPLRDSMSRVHDLEVGAARPAANGKESVPVTFTSGGKSYTSSFLVEETGSDWIFFPRWSIVPDQLPTLQASVVNSSRATINGAAVNMPSGHNSFPVFYPGSYVGSLPGEYFAASPVTTVVSQKTSPESMSLDTKATPALTTALDAKAKDFLDECAKTASSQQRLQPDCPFSYSTDNRIVDGTIAWSITQYPSASVTPFSGQWTVSPLSGKAHLTARQIDLFTGQVSQLNIDTDFIFRVDLSVSGTTITMTPVLG
ncbi:hypothetical protein [Sinomonas terrae]|uniref:Uncharacterized protein n=1 Tax=Sinomonas terrae TaxID=2908838 RepID=A0ABS9TWS7_9MICC|nr:hypothetical protein [Sinomonas terrae]MCH6468825.1 hypothetical protein [Sinomonas terrae]